MVLISNPTKTTRKRRRRCPKAFTLPGGALVFSSAAVAWYCFVSPLLFVSNKGDENIGVGAGVATTIQKEQRSGPSLSFKSSVPGTDPIRFHRKTINGTDVLWASPSENKSNERSNGNDAGGLEGPPPTGMLFVAHGCQHSNTDWFHKSLASPACDDCIGLPEERAIVRTALDLGLVTIAISSTNRWSKCWNLVKDVEPVGRVLKEFSNRYFSTEFTPGHGEQQQQPFPIYAFGASSGGAFVSSIAGPLMTDFGIQLSGFVSQIAARGGPDSTDGALSTETPFCGVYLTMNRDRFTDDTAERIVETCNDSGKASNKCKHIRLPSLPIVPSYFSNRIPEISRTESEEMVRLLKGAGIIDENTGELIRDPRQSRWRDALMQSPSEPAAGTPLAFLQRGDRLVADVSPISEVMNVAWGYHELARDGVREALEFCLAHKATAKQ